MCHVTKHTWKNEKKITTKCREILIRISRCLDWIVRVNAVGPSVHWQECLNCLCWSNGTTSKHQGSQNALRYQLHNLWIIWPYKAHHVNLLPTLVLLSMMIISVLATKPRVSIPRWTYGVTSLLIMVAVSTVCLLFEIQALEKFDPLVMLLSIWGDLL